MSWPKPLRLSSGVTIHFRQCEETSDIELQILHPGKAKFTEAGLQGLPRYVTLTRDEVVKLAFRLARCVGRRMALALRDNLSRRFDR